MNIFIINNQFGSGNIVISEEKNNETMDNIQKQVADLINFIKKESGVSDAEETKPTPPNDLFEVSKN